MTKDHRTGDRHTMPRRTVRLPQSLWDDLDDKAAHLDISPTKAIEEAVKGWIYS